MTRRRYVFHALTLAAVAFCALIGPQAEAVADQAPFRLAFLSARLQNDSENFEPTTDAERKRLTALGRHFEQRLASSGRFAIVPLREEVRAAIESGQAAGHCGGCEADYGRKLKADRVAWITVQKVSNLILNMNVYVADPQTDKYTFVKSVDIRGNTDESWSRSLNYLLDNYFFEQKS